MTGVIRQGSTVQIRQRIFDGADPVLGATAKFIIQRQSDGKYLNIDGSTWDATFVGANNRLTAVEIASTATPDTDGIYYYVFTENTAAEETYYWNLYYNDGAGFKFYADGVFVNEVSADVVSLNPTLADVYHALVRIVKDGANSEDTWSIVLVLNGVPITTGVTVPTMTLYDEDGTAVFTTVALVDSGAHRFVLTRATSNRISAGKPYFAVIAFTHGGGPQTLTVPVGRDAP